MGDEIYCVTPAQTGCTADAECTFGETTGWCHSGTCMPVGCGNLLLDPEEQCDDGNTFPLDGCAGDCRSNETCGNGVTDPQKGEQCDDGLAGVSSDGCSSTCLAERYAWTDARPRSNDLTRGSAIVYDEARGRTVMFGGTTATGYSNETWLFDGGHWYLANPVASPPARAHHGLAYDSVRERVVMFGGRSPAGHLLADLWEWDGVTWTERPSVNGPSAREPMTMAFDAARGRTIVLGGIEDDDVAPIRPDHWEWDGTTWTPRSLGVTLPFISGVLAAYDPARQVVVLVGYDRSTWEWNGSVWSDKGQLTPVKGPQPWIGLTYDLRGSRMVLAAGSITGIHVWNGTSWSTVSPPTFPSPTTLPTGDAWNGLASCPIGTCNVVSFGRADNNGGGFTETFTLLDANWRVDVKIPPVARTGHAAAYDTRRGELVIAGGCDRNDAAVFSDSWILDETGWRPGAAVPTGDYGLAGAAMAYDAARDRVVVFGGTQAGACNLFDAPLRLTYERNSTTWIERTDVEAGAPPARRSAAMAFHAGTSRIVLFGGCSEQPGSYCTSHGDTWTYDGTAWVQRMPASPPPRRGRASIAYDARRDRVVLFGGIDIDPNTATETVYGDTWEWDGSTWIERVSTTKPPARHGAGMAYDPLRGVTVLYGGVGGELDTSWEWDGTEWTERALQGSVFGLETLVYDSVQRQLVTFGGRGPVFSVLDQTYALSFRGQEPIETCIDAGDDLDGDGLAGCNDADCFGRCRPLCPPGMPATCASPSCGDSLCDPHSEDRRICPQDCAAP